MLRELRAVAKSPYAFETVKTQRPMDRNNVRSKVFVQLIKRAKLGAWGLRSTTCGASPRPSPHRAGSIRSPSA